MVSSGYSVGQVQALLEGAVGKHSLSGFRLRSRFDEALPSSTRGSVRWRRYDVRDLLVLSCSSLLERGGQLTGPSTVREIARVLEGVPADDLDRSVLLLDLSGGSWRMVDDRAAVPDAAIRIDLGVLLGRLRETLIASGMPEVWASPVTRSVVIQTRR